MRRMVRHVHPHVVTNTMTGGTAAITYTYDEWGRAVGRNIDSANSQTVTLDSLGRVTNVLNLLAPTTPGFAYTYFDPTHPTNRVGGISYPNGQSVAYNYLGNTGDERLSEIKNLTPTSTVLSQNDYTYNAVGTIATWQQQADSNIPLLWTYGYDAGDQLTSAVQTNTAITSPSVISDSYGYDPAGNVNSSNASGVTRSPTSNALNQLTGSTPSGNQTVRFSGSMNGTDTVTVGGSSATTSGTNFIGGVTLVPGSTNTVSVVATDASSNVRTNHYQAIVATQPTYTPTYDADGNELTNGAGQAYTWDAKNELASITYTGGASSLFTYDALDRRTSIVEKNSSGTVTSTKQLVWDGLQIAEERNAGNTVTKRFFALGEQLSGASYYYTHDHLGSIREMTDSSGTIQARYDYDPYGRTTLVSGTNLSDFQYAGYYVHAASGLNLTMFRAYDPNTARWLARDPIGEGAGPNLYAYVGNMPVNAIDVFGLAAVFTYTNGTTATANSAADFTNDANSSAAANGGISNITIDGHANSDAQTFSLNDTTGTGSQIDLDSDGAVALRSSNTAAGTLLSDILKGKLSPDATIVFRGCHTGVNGGVAQAASGALGTNTVGSPGPVSESNMWGTDTAPNGWNAYSDGSFSGHFSVH